MKAVVSAIEAGRCSVAVSGALLRDPEVMLALKDRSALVPMALSGHAVAPVSAVTDLGLARALSAPNGVLLLVEPEMSDRAGLDAIGKIVAMAAHKPQVVVVARSYNPFAFGALAGLRIEHVKGKGKTFLRDLPQPPEDLTAAVEIEVPKSKKAKNKKGTDLAPRFCFVGREDELATLATMLEAPGPIVVSGSHGMGKRMLVEAALEACPLPKIPELTLNRNFGFDTLVARLAHACKAHGAPGLYDAVKDPTSTPAAIVAAAVEAMGAADADAIMHIEGLHTALGRQRDFFRMSRLEMLLSALLTVPSRIRLVFTSLDQPILYREGEGKHLRRLELGGIKGRFLHEIFEAYKAPEFPRDRFGAIHDKIGGHPFAARTYAIDVRDREKGIELTEDPKFLKLEDGDLEKVRRRIEKRVEKLAKNERGALAAAAHFHGPMTAEQLTDFGLSRSTRLALLAQGLLDMTGTETNRVHRVHPLVRASLSWRETSDFDLLRELADKAWTGLTDKEGLEKIAAEQEFNAYTVGARQHRRKIDTELFDNDAMVEATIGMIRSKQPHFDLARQRLAEILNVHPNNADAHLLRLELEDAEDRAAANERRPAKKGGRKGEPGAEGERAPKRTSAFEAVAAEAMEKAPVPEVFHRIAGHYLARRNRIKAIETLEAAVLVLPEEARLKCRLGALLLRQGRRPEAIQALTEAMELRPMLPDAYGLLGMARRDEGAAALVDAEALLREAVRLGPEDPVQTARLADLLIEKAVTATDAGARSDAFTEAKELLETALKADPKAAEAQLLLAQLHRRAKGDLERAEWLLKQAKKNSERNADRFHRISLERALLLVARGDLDGAESIVRDQVARNPASHNGFATLAQVLEARQQYIPAHAEFMRAKERAPANSLWANAYDAELLRIQGIIEAQAAGLFVPPPAPAPTEPAPAKEAVTGNTAHRVIRRKGAHAEDGTEPVKVEEAGSEEAAAAPSPEENEDGGSAHGDQVDDQ